MNPIGNCRAKHTNEQEKKKERDGAGNPGPVYGQKDQAPDPRAQQKQTREQTEKSKENRNKTTKQGNSISQRQTNRRAEHQIKRRTEGGTKGGESVYHRLNARKGGEPRRGSQEGGREQTNQPIQTIPRKGGGTDSPEPVYGQKSQVPTNPRKGKGPVQGVGESNTAKKAPSTSKAALAAD